MAKKQGVFSVVGKDKMNEHSKSAIREEDGYGITVVKDSPLVFPDLWMEVHIHGGDKHDQHGFPEMFVRARCQRAVSLEKADLVVFTGGADVNPALYGEKDVHPKTWYNDLRDKEDIAAYNTCIEKGIPMFGVCRGAQFLHVMNGGRLYQHVNNHTGDHPMFDVVTKRLVKTVSSVHHQACIPNEEGGMTVLGESHVSTERWINSKVKNDGKMRDIEAFFYRDTCCLGVQGHPEYRGYFEYLQWCLKQIENYIGFSPDIEMRENNRRLKLEFMKERAARRTLKTLENV